MEQVTFWRESALANTEVLKATYVTHTFSRHSHEEYALGVIEAGVEAFDYLGTAYQAPANSLVIIHPGEVHTGQAAVPEGWQYRMIYPPVSLLQKAAIALGLPASQVPFFPTPVITNPALVQQFQSFHRALEQGVAPLESESRLLGLLSHLIHHHCELRSSLPVVHLSSQVVQQVETYLHQHYNETITLAALASTVDLSPLQLLRLCKKAWGLPPHRYLVQIRVRAAKQFIADGLALSDVAAAAGFADQSHLNRHFKRLVGVTPGQYQSGC